MAVVLAGLPPGYDLFVLDRYAVPKELVALGVAFGAGILALAGTRRLAPAAVDLLLIAYLGLGVVSAFTATNGWLALRALGVSAAGVAAFWAARTAARARGAEPLLAVVALATVLAAGTAIVQAYGFYTPATGTITRAPGGTFGNRNFMAHFVAIGLPVLLMTTLRTRSGARALLGGAGIAVCAAALVLSRSRAAWLATGAGLTFIAVEGFWIGRLWDDTTLRRRVRTLGTGALVGLLLALLLPNRLRWRSDSPYLDTLVSVANYREGSGRGRLIQYGNTLRMANDHPLLGVGPGNWPVVYPRYMSPNDPSFDADDIIPTNPWPSSDWMATVAERGYPALLLLLAIGGATAIGAWVRLRGGRRADTGDLMLIGTLVTTGVVGSFDAVLLLPAPTLLVWTTVGALAATARPVTTFTLHDRARRRLLIGGAIVAGLFVGRAALQLGAMTLFKSESLRAREWAARLDPGSYRIHMLLGDALADRRRCAGAAEHARAAAELFPDYPAPRRLLRRCGVRAR